MHVSIVTYNAQGFQSGSVIVKELLNDCYILCLQEHWLLNEHLIDLDICDDFIVVGVSGMDSEMFVVVLLVVVQSFCVNRSPH